MSNTSNNNVVAGGGIGFFGCLTILFIGLKLTNFIDWSWWYVLAPLWMPPLALLAFLLLLLCVYLILQLIKLIFKI